MTIEEAIENRKRCLDYLNGLGKRAIKENVDAVKMSIYALYFQKDNEKYLVTETCPHCDGEITLSWDVQLAGYRIHCPVCGEKIMLCDECLHADDNEGRYCDWNKCGGCFRQYKEELHK